MPASLLFIVSVPRSGSTVLTAALDRRADVIALPESHFPQALDLVEDRLLADAGFVEALFQATCTDGAFLTGDEVRACVSTDRRAMLTALGLRVAAKAGRDPAGIRVIVWKATRLVGRWRSLAAMDGRFVVLRRDPVNVFESQFRVHFGLYNRNPVRFGAFAASYEAAFRRVPPDRLFALEYGAIPERLPALLEWIGSRGGERTAGASALAAVSQSSYWHQTILGDFRNDDPEKRVRVPRLQRALVLGSLGMFSRLDPLAQALRDWADRREFAALGQRAIPPSP